MHLLISNECKVATQAVLEQFPKFTWRDHEILSTCDESEPIPKELEDQTKICSDFFFCNILVEYIFSIQNFQH